MTMSQYSNSALADKLNDRKRQSQQGYRAQENIYNLKNVGAATEHPRKGSFLALPIQQPVNSWVERDNEYYLQSEIRYESITTYLPENSYYQSQNQRNYIYLIKLGELAFE